MATLHAKDLVLGIDGGGTKTVAWLAVREAVEEKSGSAAGIVGRGIAGPSNLHAVGWEVAQQNLIIAVDAAFADAQIPPGETAAACAALAGCGREAERRQVEEWAIGWKLARRFEVVSDAHAVLAAAAPNGAGVALIAGTGSLALGRDANGSVVRAGGWGYLLGDEGSAFDIARQALAAVAQAADGRGPATSLTGAILRRRGLQEPAELINALYGAADVRGEIAALADVVTAVAAQGDAVATSILQRAAGDLAGLVRAVVNPLQLAGKEYALGLAGGMLVNSAALREQVETKLAADRIAPATVTVVAEPVAGAVVLARRPGCE